MTTEMALTIGLLCLVLMNQQQGCLGIGWGVCAVIWLTLCLVRWWLDE